MTRLQDGRLGNLGSIPNKDRGFSLCTMFILALYPTQPPIHWIP
jgi:hypothetical protein